MNNCLKMAIAAFLLPRAASKIAVRRKVRRAVGVVVVGRVAEAVAGSAVVADLVRAAVVQPLCQQLRQGLNLRSGEVGVEQRKDAAHGFREVCGG